MSKECSCVITPVLKFLLLACLFFTACKQISKMKSLQLLPSRKQQQPWVEEVNHIVVQGDKSSGYFARNCCCSSTCSKSVLSIGLLLGKSIVSTNSVAFVYSRRKKYFLNKHTQALGLTCQWLRH